MRKKCLLGTAVIFLAAALITFGGSMLYCRHCRTVTDRILYTLFLRDDATEFSSGYSERAFDSVNKGMLKDDVRRLLGDPLEIQSSDAKSHDEIWRYTRAPQDRNFWFRIVLFKNGEVVATKGDYFVD
jgi:outer membrane protein assembly factor BamE (lipoprotein component of BamABCDE complex)